jgi:hypothetical protein
MTSFGHELEPDLEPVTPNEIQENPSNGYAYWAFTPLPAAPLNETLPSIGEYPASFIEMPNIITELIRNRDLLVSGSPGSGKSHLVRELQTACITNNLPTYCLTMHKNAGKKEGISNIRPSLDEFNDKVHETGGGLVILDNLDFVAYKGKRGNPALRQHRAFYAGEAKELVEDLVSNKDLAVLGTIHDDDWRAGRWGWDDPEINEPAQAILDTFPARVYFEGNMALSGLINIIVDRCATTNTGQEPVSYDEAALVMRELRKYGRANFFHARHLDVRTFLVNPNEAIHKIEHGRTERRTIKKS